MLRLNATRADALTIQLFSIYLSLSIVITSMDIYCLSQTIGEYENAVYHSQCNVIIVFLARRRRDLNQPLL